MSRVKASVLLIHDEPMVLEVLESALQQAGYLVDGVSSAARAIRDLRALAPQVVITRDRMPLLAGGHVIRAVAAMDADIPVLVLLDTEDLGTMIGRIRQGALDCVGDPVNHLPELISAVARAAALAKKAEQRAKLQAELDEAKERMARSLAREAAIWQRTFERVNEPLEAVSRGLLRLLNQGLLQQQHQSVERILQSVERVTDRISTSSMDVTGTGSVVLPMHDLHIQEIVEFVRDALIKEAHARDVDLAFMVPADLPPMRGDRAQLRATLVDLVRLLLIPRSDGVVHITASVTRRDPWIVQFDISDSDSAKPVGGPNVIASMLPDHDTLAHVGNEGIDVTMAVRNVGALGGELQLFEEDGVGRRFCFDTALSDARRATHALDDAKLPAHDVLVAEPSGPMRRCMGNEATKLGMRVARAGTALQAKALLERSFASGRAFKVVMISLGLKDWTLLDKYIEDRGRGSRPYRIYLTRGSEYAPPAPDAAMLTRPPTRHVLISALRTALPSR